MNILDEIIAYKNAEVEVRKQLVPLTELRDSELFQRPCFSLKTNLNDSLLTGIIAEFKRKSPSKGYINRQADVKTICAEYAQNGACALSVLTDYHFFGGNSEDLVIARENNIPILRKDFIIDAYQLYASRAMGADVVLLIAACLPKNKLKELAELAKEIGLEVLLEIHNESELEYICEATDFVGINNRNLKNLEVNIQHSLNLGKSIPVDKIKIAESGINDIETISLLKSNGYKGFLIGEHFMKQANPGKAFATFAHELKEAENN